MKLIDPEIVNGCDGNVNEFDVIVNVYELPMIISNGFDWDENEIPFHVIAYCVENVIFDGEFVIEREKNDEL